MQSSNDEHFDPRAQILSLDGEQAIDFARNFFDQHCEARDAAFLAEVITAGARSGTVAYEHAVGGSPLAQLTYGTAKLHGSHTEQNSSEGLFWLMRAFNNGNAKAAIVLAGAYMDGQHLQPNLEKAFRYASFAAEKQLPSGQFILANLLVGGDGIPEDQERAIELLQTAAKAGYAPALQMLADNDISLD